MLNQPSEPKCSCVSTTDCHEKAMNMITAEADGNPKYRFYYQDYVQGIANW